MRVAVAGAIFGNYERVVHQFSDVNSSLKIEDQLATMVEYGCTEAQGYLFSRPVPASQVAALLSTSEQAPWAAGRRDQPRRPDLKVVGYDI